MMLSMPGDPAGTREISGRAVRAEQAGFASAWLPQVATVDALMALALAGAATSRIELGTAVVPTYPRHPTVLATQALTAQDATGNRPALGIGLSHRMMIEGSLGLDYPPDPHTREYLTILNGLLRRKVSFAGDLYRVNAQVAVAGKSRLCSSPPSGRTCCASARLADGTIT
jgi:alkanesulfonate monooxygenase SsuD/methylene tetrahydromethanopterin reductase-like flavin-dependent oxidoreductase (luciferase family)